MATPEELQKIIELRKQIEQSIKNSTSLLKDERDVELEKLRVLEKNRSSLEAFESLQRDVNRKISESKKEIFGVRDAFAASVNELKKQNQGLIKSRKAFEGLESIAVKLSNDQAGISRMSKKELENVKQKVRTRQRELSSAINLLEAEEKSFNTKKGEAELNKLKDKELEKEKKDEKKLQML